MLYTSRCRQAGRLMYVGKHGMKVKKAIQSAKLFEKYFVG
jgi:hypothetical protein